MKNFETPIDFETHLSTSEYKIDYLNLMEIAQGSPVVGNIAINESVIDKYRFGGPILVENKYIYAPVFIRKFFISGFKIAKIDTTNLKVEIIGKMQNLIFLNRLDNDKIYYFNDMSMSTLKFIDK